MNRLMTRVNLRGFAGYLLAIVLSLAILVGAQRLWRADLSVPFSYVGDAIPTQVFIKGMLENGWYLQNKSVGMPSGSDLRDYPMVDSLHYAVIKLLSLLSPDPALLFNLYYILTFPLTAVATLLVFRRYGLSYGLALAGSVLYAFLPYHFWRGEVHLVLAAYYCIPLMVLLLLWLCAGEAVFFRCNEERNRTAPNLLSLRAAAGVAICVLIACGGIYYAFFGCFLLVVAGAYGYLANKKAVGLWNAACSVALIAVVVFIQLVPTFVYRWQQGANPEAMMRLPADPEIYALKVVQLLLPITGHRLPWLAQLKAFYNTHFPVNENDSASMGLVASIGFLLLIGRLLYRRRSSQRPGLDDSLSVLNVFAVLLGTLGGFGVLISLVIGPHIRGYNRISVYIAFFCLFGLVRTLDKLKQQLPRSGVASLVGHSLPLLLLALGIMDQTSRTQIPLYGNVKQEYQNDAEFVTGIEAALPSHAMVFELPYSAFPEGPTFMHQMFVYDEARPYLHSKTLCWSYGAMRGRDADLWQRRVTSLPLQEFVNALVQTGFRGLYIDRNAYPDHAASLETQLAKLLNTQPFVSPNQRMAFFDLRLYSERRLLSAL